MSATLYVPTPLRKLTNGQAKVQLSAANISEIIDRAESMYPGFRERVIGDDGEIKRFINVFVNGTDIRSLQGKATPVRDGDEVSVIPAMAGGRAYRQVSIDRNRETLRLRRGLR